MAVNSMTFKQSATLLNAIMTQMTGETTIAPLDEAEFVAVATTALQSGYDALNTAISQVLERSIYSARVYDPVFPSLMRDEAKWGGITRKITFLDLDFEDDEAFSLTDGQPGPDPFIINKQKALQFNFYGGNVYELIVTTPEDQINQAFSSSAEFGSFMAAKAVELRNKIAQKIEAESRICLLNLIAADITANDDRVIHLFTEYKDQTGNTTIDISNYLSVDEFEPFAKWMYGRLNTAIDQLRNRSGKFHQNINTYNGVTVTKDIQRHTPAKNLNVYLLSQFMNQVQSNVLSSVYNQTLLSIGNYEKVDYWQAIDTPMGIDVRPNILKNDGTCSAKDEHLVQSGVIGVLFDDEAAGITVKNEGVRSIYNPRGRYYNNFHNWGVRYQNDQTENSIVLLLD